jgi:hypothetical protein
MAAKREKVESTGGAVAIYHVVYGHEGFEAAAQTLYQLVRQCQKRWPGKKRKLFLDIEGHRNSEGGFDPDMYELQAEFLLHFLGQFLSEVHCPLANVTNSKAQDDDVPGALILRDEREQ